MAQHNLHPDSQVIHAGQQADPITGAVMPPISLATTYAQNSPGEHRGYEYTRSHNPTRYALERCIARLEGSSLTEQEDVSFGGFAFSSGLAAMGTLLELNDAGAHVVAMNDLYGGSYRLLTHVRERTQGISVTYVDLTKPDTLASAINEKTSMIWVETPTNPTLSVVDLEHVASIAKDRGILTVCDSTFASPMLQQPLKLGFDMVLHSGTKYLGGHSDVLAGIAVTKQAAIAERIRYLQNAVGSVLSPFDSYLLLRGIKTLAIRIRRHCASAQLIAKWLETHPKVERVIYPGLKSHPQYDIACRQMQLDGAAAGGGMITIILKGDLAASQRFLETVSIFQLAESLGGVESLIEHPAIMTHASLPHETRAELGISDSLVRISIGIEDVADLQKDLERALEQV